MFLTVNDHTLHATVAGDPDAPARVNGSQGNDQVTGARA